MREETEEVEVEKGESIVFLSNKGAKAFKNSLTKKGFIKQRGFRKLVPPLKEVVKRRWWKVVCKHVDPGKKALVKKF